MFICNILREYRSSLPKAETAALLYDIRASEQDEKRVFFRDNEKLQYH